MGYFHKRRKHRRLQTCNLITYICLDKKGQKADEGVGTVINVSQGGVLLETSTHLDRGAILLTVLDHHGSETTNRGEVVYSNETESESFQTGVRFLGAPEKQIPFIRSLIEIYNSQKYGAVMS